MVDYAALKRAFPIVFDAKRCPECGEWMTTDYVRAPAVQSHWRGVEAWVCDCGHQEYAEE